MKTKHHPLLKPSALGLTALASATTAFASGDYGPAIWNPPCNANYYTSGYGHKFHVVHDMEGYYASTISYFKGCGFTGASVHYLVNGKQDASSDAPAGEITQMISEANYAWHALCWNQHSTGTEHEGFANNPAWYTDAQYQASAGLTRHIADKFGWAKDRNHIVAHGQKSVAGWSAWASANLGIDPNCNTHTDPGPYWDWSKYMALINNVNKWYFDTGTDGWTSAWSLSAQIWTGANSWTGSIYSDQTGDDPQVMSPSTSFAGGADACVNVQVYPQNGNTAAHDMQLFWKTDAENYLDAAKSSPIVTYNAMNQQIRLNLNVSSAKWSGQTVNQLRLDFDNTNHGNRWIVNHIYTQTTPKYWFGSSASGWVSGNALTGVTWQSDATWPGIIYADQTANDAFFYSPGGINYLGGANDQIVVRVYPQSGTSANHDMKVYWTTSSDGTWTESKSSSTVNYTAQNAWAIITLPVGANPNWSSDFVTQLRLDVDGVNSGTRWIIDYVAISQTTASKL